MRQWSCISWQSSCFRHQGSAVRIQLSENFYIEHLFTCCQMYWKDENKEKEAGIGPILTNNTAFDGMLNGLLCTWPWFEPCKSKRNQKSFLFLKKNIPIMPLNIHNQKLNQYWAFILAQIYSKRSMNFIPCYFAKILERKRVIWKKRAKEREREPG